MIFKLDKLELINMTCKSVMKPRYVNVHIKFVVSLYKLQYL